MNAGAFDSQGYGFIEFSEEATMNLALQARALPCHLSSLLPQTVLGEARGAGRGRGVGDTPKGTPKAPERSGFEYLWTNQVSVLYSMKRIIYQSHSEAIVLRMVSIFEWSS